MASLKNEVISDTLAEVELHFMTRAISKWWNSNRPPGDTRIFCGWYWVKGKLEAGPFRTKSGALRDAYYRFVLHQEPPKAWETEPPAAVTRVKRARVSKTHKAPARKPRHEARISA